MLTLFDPAQSAPLLLAARPGWGYCHYEQRNVQMDGRAARQLVFRAGDEAQPNVPTQVWLPWTALERVAALSVDIHGSGSGARIYLDCVDAGGWGLRFYLGTDQAPGWRTFQYDPADIAASWGPGAGKLQASDPLQPAALVVEDQANAGNWSLGLGLITAQAQPHARAGHSGELGCTLDRSTLTLDVQRGTARLLRGFGLHGTLPGSAPRDFRRLTVRNASALTIGHYKAELACGDVAMPLEVQLSQLSSAVWILRYTLTPRLGQRLERLDLRGSLAYNDVAGLSYGTDEEWLGELDGQPGAEPLLAEPAIWEPLALGRSGAGRLRIKADGPALKTLRLLDLRAEEGCPEYAVEIVVARDEELQGGAPLSFGVLFDGAN